MRTLTWLTFPDSDNPMGLQTYETAVMAALTRQDQSMWRFRRRTVTSLRGRQAADRRVPLGALERAPTAVARGLGRWAARGGGATHRLDLRLPPAGGAEIVTIHDLPPLRFQDEGKLPAWAIRTARDARAAICPSQFAADEVQELLGLESVVVIPNGVAPQDPAALPISIGDSRRLGLSGRPFVLHAGGATARKNLQGLAGAWPAVTAAHPDVELVLAGPPDGRRDRAFEGVPSVSIIGYQDRRIVASLMLAATCVVVPSIYEGFGLPALEAMSLGRPVVAARRGALPEVCADAALLAEPTPDGLAGALISVLSDVELQQSLGRRGQERARQFTWDRSASLHLQAYAEHLAIT